jgi:hypothetical protein
MKKTLTALMVASGVAGFAGTAFAECGGHMQSVQISKPVVTADAGQSTPVTTTTTTKETAEN